MAESTVVAFYFLFFPSKKAVKDLFAAQKFRFLCHTSKLLIAKKKKKSTELDFAKSSLLQFFCLCVLSSRLEVSSGDIWSDVLSLLRHRINSDLFFLNKRHVVLQRQRRKA